MPSSRALPCSREACSWWVQQALALLHKLLLHLSTSRPIEPAVSCRAAVHLFGTLSFASACQRFCGDFTFTLSVRVRMEASLKRQNLSKRRETPRTGFWALPAPAAAGIAWPVPHWINSWWAVALWERNCLTLERHLPRVQAAAQSHAAGGQLNVNSCMSGCVTDCRSQQRWLRQAFVAAWRVAICVLGVTSCLVFLTIQSRHSMGLGLIFLTNLQVRVNCQPGR